MTEQIAAGELVRRFTLEGKVDQTAAAGAAVGDGGSGDGAWHLLLEKESIGHKRIAQLSGVHHYSALRLNVTATLDDLPPSLHIAAYTGDLKTIKPE